MIFLPSVTRLVMSSASGNAVLDGGTSFTVLVLTILYHAKVVIAFPKYPIAPRYNEITSTHEPVPKPNLFARLWRSLTTKRFLSDSTTDLVGSQFPISIGTTIRCNLNLGIPEYPVRPINNDIAIALKKHFDRC